MRTFVSVLPGIYSHLQIELSKAIVEQLRHFLPFVDQIFEIPSAQATTEFLLEEIRDFGPWQLHNLGGEYLRKIPTNEHLLPD